MESVRFDSLVKSLSAPGTRRWLVRLVATLPLGSVLTALGQDEAAAERPHERLQRRTPQRNRKQRNARKSNKNQNNNETNNNNGGSGGPTPGPGGGGGCDCPNWLICLPNGACGRTCGDSTGCADCTPKGSICPPPPKFGPSFCLGPSQTCDNTIACNPDDRSFCSPGLECLETACAPSAFRCVQVAVCP
jgi:hypothetical protein